MKKKRTLKAAAPKYPPIPLRAYQLAYENMNTSDSLHDGSPVGTKSIEISRVSKH